MCLSAKSMVQKPHSFACSCSPPAPPSHHLRASRTRPPPSQDIPPLLPQSPPFQPPPPMITMPPRDKEQRRAPTRKENKGVWAFPFWRRRRELWAGPASHNISALPLSCQPQVDPGAPTPWTQAHRSAVCTLPRDDHQHMQMRQALEVCGVCESAQ